MAAALTLGWQALTVHANYGGFWSGLFRTGKGVPIPPGLESSTFRDSSPDGYDGQFYRIIAHDPRLRPETWAALDDPVVRSRRILVPLLAWLAAAGRPEAIDGAYVFVIAAFIFGGVYWLARCVQRQGRHPAWALIFLIVPPTIVSIDRMTVDVALGALAAAMIFFLATGREKALWFTLAAACLVRETGLLLVAACVLPALWRRDLRAAALWTAASLPALGWFGYLQAMAPPAPSLSPLWFFKFQLGALAAALDPPHYGLAPQLEWIARGLDSLALAALAASAVLALVRMRRTPSGPEQRPEQRPEQGPVRAGLGLHAVFLLAITNRGFWTSPFGYTRPFAPLFVLLLSGPGAGPAALLCALIDLRLFTEIKSQVIGVLHWL